MEITLQAIVLLARLEIAMLAALGPIWAIGRWIAAALLIAAIRRLAK